MRLLRVAALALLSAGPAYAQDGGPLEPKVWTVPWESTRPRDPVMDQSGKVWFVGQQGNYLAYLDPKSGEFKRYAIDDGTHPHNVVVDERGGIWYTGNRNGRIVQLDPASGELKNIMMPDTLRDPHTMIWGKDGVAWFTAQRANKIGRLDRATGEVRVFSPSEARSGPYGAVVDANGQPWFNLFGTNKIATVDPKTLQYKEYALPERSRARRIATTSDGGVWVGDYRGVIVRLDPKTGTTQEWPLPSGPAAQPYAMTSDDQDRLWIVETGVQPNRLVGFDAKSKTWVANIPIPSSGAARNTVRHMTFNLSTREIWFGTDAGTIGHVKVPKEITKLVP